MKTIFCNLFLFATICIYSCKVYPQQVEPNDILNELKKGSILCFSGPEYNEYIQELYCYDLESNKKERLTFDEKNHKWYIDISNDREKIVYCQRHDEKDSQLEALGFFSTSFYNFNVYKMKNRELHEITRFRRPNVMNLCSSWSPDEKRLLFERRRLNVRKESNAYQDYFINELWMVNEDGTEERQITMTDKEGWYTYPDWAPKEEIAVFCREERNNKNAIYFLDLKTGKERKIYSHQADGYEYIQHVKWSPDGQKLAFLSTKAPNFLSGYLYVMDKNGRPVKEISSKKICVGFSWIDEDTILGTAAYDSNSEICIIDLTNSKVHRITYTEWNEASPVFIPYKMEKGTNYIHRVGVKYLE